MQMRGVILLAIAFTLRAEVSNLHPRIYVRNDAARVGRGLTVPELRARLRDAAYSRWRTPMQGERRGAIVELAARYLEEGRSDDLAAVRAELVTRTRTYGKDDVGSFLAGAEIAIAFDWTYAGFTAEERNAAMANIVTMVDGSARFLRSGGPDINHNYTYMALNSVAVGGLVLSGEPAPFGAKAAEYLDLARHFLEDRGRVLDTWGARQGAWGEGSHYTFHETLRTLVLALHAYRSASDADYFPRIRVRHGDFIRGAGRFLMGSTRPDMTFERIGDTLATRSSPSPTVPLTVEMLAAGVEDLDEAARLRSYDDAVLAALGDKTLHYSFHWGMRIFWDPRAPRTPSFHTLPLFQRFGAGTYEHIVWRNGASAGSTQITILGGDHYTDHQHFDKGQFLIYHRGGLAVDSGAYDHMYEPGKHSNEYAPRTLAHNCLLVYDAAQVLPKGYGNDGGQLILRGLQHHGDWQTFLAHRISEDLHTAAVTAYDTVEKQYAYVEIDLAAAYGARVEQYRRSFVYLPEADWLLVHDRVVAAQPGFEKRWLLHFQERPAVGGTAVEPGVRRFESASSITERFSDGALHLDSLLPERRAILTVGGPGFEFYNLFTGRNYPVSNPAVAAGIREPGAWRIEVAPAAAAKADVFLNSLQMRDASAPHHAVRLVRPEGAQLLDPKRNHVVMFTPSLPLHYTVEATAPASHMVAGLPPGQSAAIRIGGRALPPAAANAAGVLRFDDPGTGSREVSITPLAAGAER